MVLVGIAAQAFEQRFGESAILPGRVFA